MKRPGNDDVGLELINRVYDLMQIDPKWVIWEPRGFTWWGWHYAQRVWADPPLGDHVRLHARADVLDGFDESDPHLAVLGVVARTMTLSGFVRSENHTGRLQLASSVYVHPGIQDWIKVLFPLAVAMQACEAAIFANTLGDLLGARPAKTAHPDAGPRHEMDDMLNVIELMVRPKGMSGSLFAGDEMKNLLGILEGRPCVLATGDTSGIT